MRDEFKNTSQTTGLCRKNETKLRILFHDQKTTPTPGLGKIIPTPSKYEQSNLC